MRALLASYAQGAGTDEPLAELRNGTAGYYAQDGLGSVISIAGATGTVLNSDAYDSFGNLTASTGSFSNPFQYTRRDSDSETGLRYYRARYYDPQIGRFLSEDPIGFLGGANFYAYVGNSSPNYGDPLGMLADDKCRALRKILDLEKEHGTLVAAFNASLDVPGGEHLLMEFNSDNPENQKGVNTARGVLDIDWFATLEASSLPPLTGPAFTNYVPEKTLSILIRLGQKALGYKVQLTNYNPFWANPYERKAAVQASIPWVGFKDLFPPGWMAKECPKECKR